MIGFGGAPTGAPPVAIGPTPRTNTFLLVAPGASRSAITSTDTGPGSGQLRFTVLVAPNTPTAGLLVNGAAPNFQVAVGDQVFAAVPAVANEPLLPNVRYPLVARLPAGVFASHGGDLPIAVSMDVPSTYPAGADLVQVELEMVPGPHTRPPGANDTATGLAVVAVPAQLATLTAQVLDASGVAIPNNKPLPRGRAVLEVHMDALNGQRAASALAGMAGFEVWLDNTELVAVPTALDGPAIGGTWRIAFDPGRAAAGQHVIDVRAFGSQRGIAFTEAFASFALPQ